MSTCCICLDFVKKGSFKTECCRQELHQKCIEKWTGTCPICRGDYVKNMSNDLRSQTIYFSLVHTEIQYQIYYKYTSYVFIYKNLIF